MKTSFFSGNRRHLRDAYGEGPILIASNDEMQRKADAAFEFAQDSNFFYLTGINEAGWVLLLVNGEETLFGPMRSDSQVLFDGAVSYEEARNTSGIKTVVSIDTLDDVLASLAEDTSAIGLPAKDPHAKYYGFSMNTGPEKLYKKAVKHFKERNDVRPLLAKLRAIKQPEEIAQIKKAVAISVRAFEELKLKLPNFTVENQLTAQLSYDFFKESAGGHAYTPIVAGGAHACTLHYSKNDAPLPKNGLVLIDAGVQVSSYASDITRTYGLGAPSARQVEIHAAVEAAHKDIIALITPGGSLKEYSDKVDEIMKSALATVGLLHADDDYRKYFPHSISHGLGLDVHDSLGGYKEFMPGMVLTVEPGIYIPEEGIGVRIEDDILVTADGNENLSAVLPTGI